MSTLTMRGYKNTGFKKEKLPKLKSQLLGKIHIDFDVYIQPIGLYNREKSVNVVGFENLQITDWSEEDAKQREALKLFKELDFFEFYYVDEEGKTEGLSTYYCIDPSFEIEATTVEVRKYPYSYYYAGIAFRIIPDVYMNYPAIPVIKKKRRYPW